MTPRTGSDWRSPSATDHAVRAAGPSAPADLPSVDLLRRRHHLIPKWPPHDQSVMPVPWRTRSMGVGG